MSSDRKPSAIGVGKDTFDVESLLLQLEEMKAQRDEARAKLESKDRKLAEFEAMFHPLVEHPLSASKQDISQIETTQAAKLRYTVCSSEYILRCVHLFYTSDSTDIQSFEQQIAPLRDVYSVLKSYFISKDAFNGHIVGLFKRNANGKPVPEETISGFISSKLSIHSVLISGQLNGLAKCIWIHQTPVFRIFQNGRNQYDDLDLVCFVEKDIIDETTTKHNVFIPLVFIEYGKSSSHYSLASKEAQVCQGANTLIQLMDFDKLYRLSLPLLGITIIDIHSIEIKLFQLVKEPNGKAVNARVAEVTVYSGAILSEEHFLRIMLFVDLWIDLMANYISSAEWSCTDNFRSFHMFPGTNVCLVREPVSLSIVPDRNHEAELLNFPQQLYHIDSARIYKCYDYRESLRKMLPEIQFRRNHSAYKDLVGGYREEINYHTDSDSFVLISYDYLEGDHVPSRVSQLVSLLDFLVFMHQRKLCHGDIRLLNAVFPSEQMIHDGSERSIQSPTQKFVSRKPQLIDFDFAGEAGVRLYPMGYVQELPDGKRHSEAQEKMPLRESHDLFAFASICEMFTLDNATEQQQEVWRNAFETMFNSISKSSSKFYEDFVQLTQTITQCSLNLRKQELREFLENRDYIATGTPPRKRKPKDASPLPSIAERAEGINSRQRRARSTETVED